MIVYWNLFFLVYILALSSVIGQQRCPNTAPIINMCSNEVKTKSKVFVEIDIKPEDNINNCTCILQPTTEKIHRVTIQPLYPDKYWCHYILIVKTVSTTGKYNCAETLLPTQFSVTQEDTVDISLKKESTPDGKNITRCFYIQSDDADFKISCSLPNYHSPPILTTPLISTVTIRDTNAPMLTSSLGRQTDNNSTQEKRVGAIVGGVVGAIVIGIIIVIVSVIFLRKRRQEKGKPTGQTSVVNSGFIHDYENVTREQLDSAHINDHRLSGHYSEISDTNRVAVVKPQPRVIQTEGTYNTVSEPPVSDHYNVVGISPSDTPQTTNNKPTDHYTMVDLTGEDGAPGIVNPARPKPLPPSLATKPKTSQKPKFPMNVKELYAVVNKPKRTKKGLSTNDSTPTPVVVNKPNKGAQVTKPDVEYAVVNKNR